MKTYSLIRTQFLPITLQEAWAFFSSPDNLFRITPEHMKFRILYKSGGRKMYPGQIIKYTVNGLPRIPMKWTTEITHVQEPFYFADEQRTGPYKLWHHQHHFRELADGVEIKDEVNYALPLGVLGRFAHWLFVRREVNRIFDYRCAALEKYFPKKDDIND
jgi:ligand-binding SRPBCC domain-containing protein